MLYFFLFQLISTIYRFRIFTGLKINDITKPQSKYDLPIALLKQQTD